MDVQELLRQLQAVEMEMAPLKKEADYLKQKIKDAVLETGISVTSEYGYARFSSGYTRDYWDGKGLTGYAVAHPEILKFRSQTPAKPTVQIKAAL